MQPKIRPARSSDVEQIRSFTTDTFDWGDYVPELLPEWIEDPRGSVLVAVDDHDRPVGVSRAVLLSPREAWLHATRVSPSHRRMGIGHALNEAARSWAARQGAVVARLLVEDWNVAAIRQVTASGFRPVARWTAAGLDIGVSVVPTTNGGRRVPSEERLVPGRSTEVDLAWMSWVNGDIARTGREMIPFGWHLRRGRPSDLRDAASRRALWQSASGWVVASLIDATLDVSWISTTDIDVRRLVKALTDLAEGMRAEHVHLLVPRTEWLVEELARSGFTLAPNTVYERGI